MFRISEFGTYHRISSPDFRKPQLHRQPDVFPAFLDEVGEFLAGLADAGPPLDAHVRDLGDLVAELPGPENEVDEIFAVVAAERDLVQDPAPEGDEPARVVLEPAAEDPLDEPVQGHAHEVGEERVVAAGDDLDAAAFDVAAAHGDVLARRDRFEQVRNLARRHREIAVRPDDDVAPGIGDPVAERRGQALFVDPP